MGADHALRNQCHRAAYARDRTAWRAVEAERLKSELAELDAEAERGLSAGKP